MDHSQRITQIGGLRVKKANLNNSLYKLIADTEMNWKRGKNGTKEYYA